MKRFFNTLALTALAIVPIAATAQKNISGAIDTFGSDTGKYGIWNKVEENDNGGAYCTTYKFKLPKKEEKKLDFIRKAFYEDMPEAYDVFIKKAKEGSKANKLIAYGDRLDKRISLGWGSSNDNMDKNYLFMFVHSKDNANYRYVYGMEWQYKGKNVEGSVMKIYSRDPKKAKRNTLTIRNGNSDDNDLDNAKSLAKDLKEIKSLGKLTKIFGGKLKSGNDVIEQKNGKTVLKSGKKYMEINEDGSIYMDDGEGNTMSLDSNGNVTNMNRETTSTNDDPIQQFANLRAAYLNNVREGNIDNTTLLTGLANSILELCKTKGQQMTTDEKQLCTDGLKDMQEQTPDKFIKGIFGVAISELNKFSKK